MLHGPNQKLALEIGRFKDSRIERKSEEEQSRSFFQLSRRRRPKKKPFLFLTLSTSEMNSFSHYNAAKPRNYLLCHFPRRRDGLPDHLLWYSLGGGLDHFNIYSTTRFERLQTLSSITRASISTSKLITMPAQRTIHHQRNQTSQKLQTGIGAKFTD